MHTGPCNGNHSYKGNNCDHKFKKIQTWVAQKKSTLIHKRRLNKKIIELDFIKREKTWETHMEYLMASMADSAGRKSSTSTFLFSFFLSIIGFEWKVYNAAKYRLWTDNQNLKIKWSINLVSTMRIYKWFAINLLGKWNHACI